MGEESGAMGKTLPGLGREKEHFLKVRMLGRDEKSEDCGSG